MEKIMKEDLYIDHATHPKPYWKTMSKCSECYKKHWAIVNRSKLNSVGVGTRRYENITSNPEENE